MVAHESRAVTCDCRKATCKCRTVTYECRATACEHRRVAQYRSVTSAPHSWLCARALHDCVRAPRVAQYRSVDVSAPHSWLRTRAYTTACRVEPRARAGGGRKGGARVKKLQVHPSRHAEPPHPPDQRCPRPRATGLQSAAGVGPWLREQPFPTQSNLVEATLRPGTPASESEVLSLRRCLRPTAAMVVRCGFLLPHRVRIVLDDRVRATRGLRCSPVGARIKILKFG